MNSVEASIEEDSCGWVCVNGISICIETDEDVLVVSAYDTRRLDEGVELDDAELASFRIRNTKVPGGADGTV